MLAFSIALAAGCTVPQFDCGRPVPCARGSVQSCISHDHSRCHYLFDDGTVAECASCDDCFGAEREIIAWCGGDDPLAVGSSGGSGNGSGGDGTSASPGDLATAAPPDMSIAAPPDLSNVPDLARNPRDLSTLPADDLSPGPIDTDLGCYGFGYSCGGDPTCCAHCCVGGCTIFGFCAQL